MEAGIWRTVYTGHSVFPVKPNVFLFSNAVYVSVHDPKQIQHDQTADDATNRDMQVASFVLDLFEDAFRTEWLISPTCWQIVNYVLEMYRV